jgi:hypothetical protein
MHVYTWIELTYVSDAHVVFTALSANVVVVVAAVSVKLKVAAARRNGSVEFGKCITRDPILRYSHAVGKPCYFMELV